MIRGLIAIALLGAACQQRNRPAAVQPPLAKPADDAGVVTPPKPDPGTIAVQHPVAWLQACLQLGEALVHSDAAVATAVARRAASHNPPSILATLLQAFPVDINEQRTRFAKLSAELRTIRKADEALRNGTVVMHCPMVASDWIQQPGELRNPYMPDTMLRCGYQVEPALK